MELMLWKLKFNKTSLVSKKWPLLVNCCKIFTVFTFVSIGWLFFFYSAYLLSQFFVSSLTIVDIISSIESISFLVEAFRP
jgi:hypothetical protein